MRKYYLSVLAASIAFGGNALEVTTEPTYKSSVIEEFTGIHCGNCPDGHYRAAQLLQAAPENVFVVSIHAGSFATPGKGEPNYITEKGQELHDHFDISSYPCGMTSRRDVGNRLVQGRADWGASSRVITRELSPVNIAMESAWDASTRNLTVHVKGYCVEAMEDPRLTVMVLQNNILGPQAGGLLGNDYPHRHMLRMMMCQDVFGDKLDSKQACEYFEREYSAVIPEDIDGVPFIPYDMELLAFVAEGEGEIVKAVENVPEVASDESTRFIVVPNEPLIPIGNTYALDYLEMYLRNYSGEMVTTAKFDVTMNNETRELKWEGSIPPHSGQTIRIPLEGWWKESYDSDTNNYKVKMKSANDRPQELEVSTLSGRFKDLPSYPADLKFKIRTDLDAQDNRYLILDEEGNVVHEFGPYADNNNKDYEETVNLEENKVYGFEVSDAWGNGVYHPRGSVKIYDSSNGIRGQMQEIDGYGMRMFFRTSNDDSGITRSVTDGRTGSSEMFDVNGRLVKAGYRGVCIIRTVLSDGSVKTEKILN